MNHSDQVLADAFAEQLVAAKPLGLKGAAPFEPLAVVERDIPAFLKTIPRWVVWKLEPRDAGDEPRKIPYDPRTGRRATGIGFRNAWSSFGEAIVAYRCGRYAGIGFAFDGADHVVGIDLDDCRHVDGRLEPWAAEIVRMMATYTEVSPSGTGVKLYCLANLTFTGGTSGKNFGVVEMYASGRWFAVTGDRLGDNAEIAERTHEAASLLLAAYETFAEDDRSGPPPASTPRTGTASDVVARAVKYLGKMSPAISGSGGHNALMTAARAVVYGFDLGVDAGLDLLATHYNPRCQPPWSDKDLRHKCEDADRKPFNKPRGYLRDQERPTNGTHHRNGQTGQANGGGHANGHRDEARDDEEEPPHDPEPGPDHDSDAERNVIGAVLSDPHRYPDVASIVQGADFRIAAHAETWRVFEDLAAAGRPIDLITVNDAIRSRGKHDVATPGYLAEIRETAVGENIVEHAEIVAEKAADRRLSDILGKIQDSWRATDRPASDKIAEAEELLAAARERRGGGGKRLRPIPFRELIDAHPALRPPIIDGLLRQGETMNVIAAPKVGKSWLTVGLAFAVSAGRPWLGFPTTRGRVLLIDNELHPETLASRLRRIAESYGQLDDIETLVDVVPLRGRLHDLHRLGDFLKTVEPGTYALVIVDAFYRTIPNGLDENDNAAVAGLYNLLDTFADRLRCAFALVHHSSKGNQASRGITDVGSGAGSQSRAADSHVILRPHEEENIVVMEAVVRSFAAPLAKCLRWNWPLFTPTLEFNPADLLKPNQKRKAARGTPVETEEPVAPKPDPWTAQRFADAFVTDEPKWRSVIIDDARLAGVSERLAGNLLQTAIDREIAFAQRAPGSAPKMRISKVPFAAEKPRRKGSRKGKKCASASRAHVPPHTPPGCEDAPGGG